jgi:hypothetical protein
MLEVRRFCYYFLAIVNTKLILYLIMPYMEPVREIGWDGGDWIDLAQDRDQWRALVRAVMNLRVP